MYVYRLTNIYFTKNKVHIFWEGHKILRNLRRRFVLCSNGQNFVAFSEYMNFNKLFGSLTPTYSYLTLKKKFSKSDD